MFKYKCTLAGFQVPNLKKQSKVSVTVYISSNVGSVVVDAIY